MTDTTMTCAEFQALASDYLEPLALSIAQRSRADAHLAGCAECAALVADLRAIVRGARDLAALTPSRDLWTGVEARIEAPVVAIASRSGEHEVAPMPVQHAGFDVRRLAIAASLLVAATAGITYTLTRGGGAPETASAGGSAGPQAPVAGVVAVARPSAAETFDREIAALRTIVDARRAELDTATVRIVEGNLKLIDAAIAESKAALANDPASAFLVERLTHAYDTKLQFLRALATRPAGA